METCGADNSEHESLKKMTTEILKGLIKPSSDLNKEIKFWVDLCINHINIARKVWIKEGAEKVLWEAWTSGYGVDALRIVRIQKRVQTLDKSSKKKQASQSQPFLGKPLLAFRHLSHVTLKHELLFELILRKLRMTHPSDIITAFTLAFSTLDILDTLDNRLMLNTQKNQKTRGAILECLIRNSNLINNLLEEYGGWSCMINLDLILERMTLQW